jgi:hypothetical protein
MANGHRVLIKVASLDANNWLQLARNALNKTSQRALKQMVPGSSPGAPTSAKRAEGERALWSEPEGRAERIVFKLSYCT